MGSVCEVLIGRDVASGELVGVLCRSEQDVYVNGQVRTVGGIGGVRIAAAHRGRGLLRLGWSAFGHRELPYLGVIAAGNTAAVRSMVQRPPGAARVAGLDGLTTLGLVVHRHHRVRAPRGCRIEACRNVPELIDFLNCEGPRYQFAPVRRAADFTDGRLRGLALGDVLVARRGGRIVGSLAVWDQRWFKQDVVAAYGPGIRGVRPLLDVAMRALGSRTMPAVGDTIPAVVAALMMVSEDDPQVFGALLDAALVRARRRGAGWLMLGLAQRSPLLPVARRRLHVTYRASLFAVSWTADDPVALLDGRPAYMEIGAL